MIIPRRQHEFDRIPQPIHNSVQLCIQPASGPPNCLIRRFFPSVGTFVNLMQVESKLRFSISASADNTRNTPSNVPSSRHLANRAYTDCQGPYASGNSRHCAPLWAIQSIPLSIFRSSFRGRPHCPVLSGGSTAFTRSHCSVVNSYRFMFLFSHSHLLCAIFIFQTRSNISGLKKRLDRESGLC